MCCSTPLIYKEHRLLLLSEKNLKVIIKKILSMTRTLVLNGFGCSFTNDLGSQTPGERAALPRAVVRKWGSQDALQDTVSLGSGRNL